MPVSPLASYRIDHEFAKHGANPIALDTFESIGALTNLNDHRGYNPLSESYTYISPHQKGMRELTSAVAAIIDLTQEEQREVYRQAFRAFEVPFHNREPQDAICHICEEPIYKPDSSSKIHVAIKNREDYCSTSLFKGHEQLQRIRNDCNLQPTSPYAIQLTRALNEFLGH